MRITMIGAGYVGLVSGTCFAEFGHEVTCVDKDENKIHSLSQGIIPIYEPGLEILVKENTERKRLKFSTDIKTAISEADVIYIAVGTPSRRGDGYADLSYVHEVIEAIGQSLKKYAVIATKSTVPVGTGQKLTTHLKKINPHLEFDIVSNPEFLREGSAIEDFMNPDRVIVGANSARAIELMRELYLPLLAKETPILFTNLETAELIKYASNAFLATKIAFINEIADLCEKCNADIQAVSEGMGMDKRIGEKFLQAGPGYGGSCFPKDTLALTVTAQEFQSPMSIVETVVQSNRKRKESIAHRIIEAMGDSVKGKTIAVLGVTFKPNTDDMRESPSLDIIPTLQSKGAKINVFDPQGKKEGFSLLPGVEWCSNPYSAIEGADSLVVITEWNEFEALDFARIKQLLKNPVVVDLRNIYHPQEMEKAGFSYYSIGRPSVTSLQNSLVKAA
ncbi:MAG: UDP-glucose/GDP-mannose dehydrogenase family protein [Candidatus Paracaedimonas acanthamoebae]|uniref:UDP-glucose 6-dehydrogenase n=1 Tax=Candidatus Paracaedimonas acanthamoebae TaxID=244581 RepID=A0A8J7TUT3_9PROT|nr:UDP-glucose/GDP-mannose dehydrogenase family protein [Candidatus Paracaedimonas acanthamoebae]